MLQDKFVLADGATLKESIVGVSWSTSSNSDSDITPGSVCASAVEIELWVSSDSALSVTQGTVLTYYKVDTELETETKLGVFTCDKPEKTGANKYKVTAYDNVTLLDVDVSEWLNALAFPISIKDFAASLANKCELELANEPRLNKDYQIQKFTGSGVNARDLMKMVCSASGCFCNANADGKLSFDWYKKNKNFAISISKSANERYFYLLDTSGRSLHDNIERALIISRTSEESVYEVPYFANQLTFSDFTVKAIDKVQVKQSDDDVGVIYPSDAQGTNALVIQGNQLLSTTSDEALRPYVKNLYDGLNNITYVPCSNIQTPETLDIKVGDIVTVSDGKHQFETWITDVTHSGNKCTFRSIGNANRNTTTAVNNTKYDARQKIAELKASVDGIVIKLSDYSTTEEMEAAIEASASEISATVVKNGEVRSKFALDSSSCTIESGVVAFKGHAITIDGDNFKLYGDGTVDINGSFRSNGSVGNAYIYDGRIYLDAVGKDGTTYSTISLSRVVEDNPSGHITIHGKNVEAISATYGASSGGIIVLRDSSSNDAVTIQAGSPGKPLIKLTGDNSSINLAGYAPSLNFEGSGTAKINAYSSQMTIKPRSAQNALYVDWQYFKTINGEGVYALVGKTTPWT